MKEKNLKRNRIVSVPSNNRQQKPKKQKIVEKMSSNSNGSSSTVKENKISKVTSIEDGRKMFDWIINPISSEEFFTTFWEKKPKVIKRSSARDYYSSLLSVEIINSMLKENHLEYTKNIDVTSYRDGVRETHNPGGRAIVPAIWSYYDDGCSLRILNPQTFHQPIYKMNAKLQELFHCMVGTNVYLTPPNSQGFAPHYDDIEAFVLQIEGAKKWKVYQPRNHQEQLARVSSENFSQDDIEAPLLEVTLEAGDMLYFPRGFIHQAETIEGKHSLHITVSMYQKNSYADLMEALVPAALQSAIDSDVRFREGLPLDIHQFMGIAFSENDNPQRTQYREKIKELFSKIFDHANIDDAVDQMSKKFQIDALPPYLSKDEKSKSVFGEKVKIEDGKVSCPFEITLGTNIRLLKANILRLVDEEGTLKIYFHTQNSKEYHEFPPNPMEIDEDDSPIIMMLVNEYPKFVKVDDLPIDDGEKKLAIITDLWENGMLMTDKNVQ